MISYTSASLLPFLDISFLYFYTYKHTHIVYKNARIFVLLFYVQFICTGIVLFLVLIIFFYKESFGTEHVVFSFLSALIFFYSRVYFYFGKVYVEVAKHLYYSNEYSPKCSAFIVRYLYLKKNINFFLFSMNSILTDWKIKILYFEK